MSGASKHVVICGAGVIGLCCAHYLRERGHAVTIVDRESSHHKGCSYGNAGMIVPSHVTPLAAPGMVALGLKWMLDAKSPFYIRPRWSADLFGWGWRFARAANADHVARSAPLLARLQLASRSLFEGLADRTGNEIGLVQRGLLLLCKTEHALEEEAAAAARTRELGVPAEVISPARAAELDPEVRMDVAGGIYFPLDCHLTPQRFMATLLRGLQQCGVSFRWETPITCWRVAGDRIAAARTAHDEIAADEFILAGGSWSPAMVRELGLKLPMQAGKGYSLTLPKPPRLPRLCSILAEARVAVTPMGTALRVGGTMELSGLDLSIRLERVRGITESVTRYLPDFQPKDFNAVPAWSGLRPCSPDGLPYVGRFRRYPNLCAATGHAMMGLSLGPVTGQLVAEIISDEKPSHPLEALDPDRYA
jgi:D-amino-acid dehydrogenase